MTMRPVDKKYPITLPYHAPGRYIAGYHTGVDYGCPVGTPVHATVRGTVVTSDFDARYYGNYVILAGWLGRKHYLFAHMSHRYVHVGQKVVRGQQLGLSGETGNATGPHVHAEQRHKPFGYNDHEQPYMFGKG